MTEPNEPSDFDILQFEQSIKDNELLDKPLISAVLPIETLYEELSPSFHHKLQVDKICLFPRN